MLSPIVVIDHDRERYMIQVELMGVKMDDIELEVTETSFCIHAEREDAEITGCYYLAHPVKVEDTDATFDGELLNVAIPFKSPIKGMRVNIRPGTLDFAQKDPRKMEERLGKGSLGIGTQ